MDTPLSERDEPALVTLVDASSPMLATSRIRKEIAEIENTRKPRPATKIMVEHRP